MAAALPCLRVPSRSRALSEKCRNNIMYLRMRGNENKFIDSLDTDTIHIIDSEIIKIDTIN